MNISQKVIITKCNHPLDGWSERERGSWGQLLPKVAIIYCCCCCCCYSCRHHHCLLLNFRLVFTPFRTFHPLLVSFPSSLLIILLYTNDVDILAAVCCYASWQCLLRNGTVGHLPFLFYQSTIYRQNMLLFV